MVNLEKRALLPSFLFLGAFCFALISSSITGHVYLWLCIAFLVLIYISGFLEGFKLTALAIALFAFGAAVLGSILLVAYDLSEEGLYYIFILMCSFVVFSCISRERQVLSYKIALGCFIILALWGLVQYFTGLGYLLPNWPRAKALFVTPNTFAAALNLVIFPAIAAYVFRYGRSVLYVIIMLLFSALLVTQSRGGYLSFIFSFIVIFIFSIYKKPDFWKVQLFRMAAGLVLVFVLFSGYEALKANRGTEGVQRLHPGVATLARLKEGSSGRVMFYEAALKHIRENPVTGYGFMNFRHYYHRDQHPWNYRLTSFAGFVHNDYLQIWSETGLPGILALLAFIYIFYRTMYLAVRRTDDPFELIIITGMTSAVSGYFFHALVDFVLYPPALLFVFGAYLGVVNGFSGGIKLPGRFNLKRKVFTFQPAIMRTIIGTGLLLILVQPVVAQLAGDIGTGYANKGELPEAQKYYNLARRFAPYEPDYYFLEGRIWFNAAIAGNNSDAANYADSIFKQGAELAPFELDNRLMRVFLHRDHPDLLTAPASPDTISRWFDEMLLWHPDQEQVYIEYIKTLDMAGKQADAERVLNRAITCFPLSSRLQVLKQSVNHAPP